MTVNEGMYTSSRDDWETPQNLFDKLNDEFHFELDVAASEHNHKCEKYFDRDIDGLSQRWHGVCFMNPPYGREIGKWVAKADEEAMLGATVVCLLPARTDTAWWHDHVMKYEVRFIRGRLKFTDGDGKTGPAPFPSAVVVMKWTG